jgi:hypothetical protein
VIPRLARWRARIGFLAIVILSFPSQGLGKTLDDWVIDYLLNILVAAITTVLAILILWLVTRGSTDPVDARSLWAPLGRIAKAALVVCLMFIAVPLFPPLLIWYYPFLLCCFYYWGEYLFDTGEAHPLLPPFVTAITVILATLLDAGAWLATPGRVPTGLHFLMSVSGLVSTLTLCLWEILLIRSKARDRAAGSRWVDDN